MRDFSTKGCGIRMIVLFVNKQRKYDVQCVERMKIVCQKAMDVVASASFVDSALKVKSTCLSVTISFVGAEHMKKTNYEYRDINEITDVLSFPLLDMQNGKLLKPLGAQDILWHKDGIGEISLGDVLISLDKAKTQADDLGHSLEREVAFLAVHAALHLIGFDHIQSEDDKRMISEQKRMMKKLYPSETEKNAIIDLSGTDDHETSSVKHSGFAAIIGKPNVGKSTLLNQLAGYKLSIISGKPQTTRNNIRAVINRFDAQVIFVDTPGILKPKDGLSRFMADSSVRAVQFADVILFMIDGRFSTPSEADRKAIEIFSRYGKPVILVINKVDCVVKESILPIISVYSELYPFRAMIPVSAKSGDGLELLLDETISLLPSGPKYYPDIDFTDQSERSITSELIREQILHFTNQEVPHGTAVLVDRFEEIFSESNPEEREMVRVFASIVCEKKTHKAIILGKEGQMIKRIGTSARRSIEGMTGCKVFLDLHVKVRNDWKNLSSHLNELGYRKGD